MAQTQDLLRQVREIAPCAREWTEGFLLALVRHNAETEYGKRYGFSEIKSVADYQQRVPLSKYDDYRPYIDREILQGEAHLLSADNIVHYASTSGSVGVPKRIPVSDRFLQLYAGYVSKSDMAMLGEYLAARGGEIRPGRTLNLVQSTLGQVENGISFGAISAAVLAKVRANNAGEYQKLQALPLEMMFYPKQFDQRYLRLLFGLQDKTVARIYSAFTTILADTMKYLEHNWQDICGDIERGQIDPAANIPSDLRVVLQEKLRPNPARARELREIFSHGFDTPVLQAVFPNLQLICSIGTGSFSVYTAHLRRYSGDIPLYFNFYAASEMLAGIAMGIEETEYTLLPNTGWYEFIPVDDECERPLPIAQLEAGKEYEIVATNLSGFYRYRIGDVVKVTGFFGELPRLQFAYRKNQMISIAGEKTNEAHLQDAVTRFTGKTGVPVADYSIWIDSRGTLNNYVLLIEPDRPFAPENLPQFTRLFDALLGEANPSYGSKVKNKVIGPMQLLVLQPETYLLYRDTQTQKGISANQLKPVRVVDIMTKERFFFALLDPEYHDEETIRRYRGL